MIIFWYTYLKLKSSRRYWLLRKLVFSFFRQWFSTLFISGLIKFRNGIYRLVKCLKTQNMLYHHLTFVTKVYPSPPTLSTDPWLRTFLKTFRMKFHFPIYVWQPEPAMRTHTHTHTLSLNLVKNTIISFSREDSNHWLIQSNSVLSKYLGPLSGPRNQLMFSYMTLFWLGSFM